MEHSLRRRQLSVTQQDKTLISRNQISAENTRVEGQGNQQKTAETLLWAVQQRMFLSSVFFFVLFFHTVVVSVHSSFYAWEGQPPLQDNASSLAAWRTEHDLVNLPRQHIHTYTHKLTFLLFIFIVGLYVYVDRLNFFRIWLTLCFLQSEYSSTAAGSSMSTTEIHSWQHI